jgi:hypothetical protein
MPPWPTRSVHTVSGSVGCVTSHRSSPELQLRPVVVQPGLATTLDSRPDQAGAVGWLDREPASGQATHPLHVPGLGCDVSSARRRHGEDGECFLFAVEARGGQLSHLPRRGGSRGSACPRDDPPKTDDNELCRAVPPAGAAAAEPEATCVDEPERVPGLSLSEALPARQVLRMDTLRS